MKILKQIFLDDKIRFFTSSKDLHYLSKLHLFQTDEPSTEWLIPHRMGCQGIVTQVFYPTENNTFEIMLPDSIIHEHPNQTRIVFSEPQEGVAFLVCPQVIGSLDWEEVKGSLNLINSGWINRTSGIN